MCIKVHPVPVIRITKKTTSDSLNTPQSLIKVITCVASFTCIVFILRRQHLPAGNCIQLMDIIESFLIISIQVQEKVRSLRFSFFHRIIPGIIHIDYRQDCRVTLSGNKKMLIIKVVIQADNAAHCKSQERFV